MTEKLPAPTMVDSSTVGTTHIAYGLSNPVANPVANPMTMLAAAVERGASIDVLTKLYGGFKHDVRMTVGDIQTNIDPKRDQTKSLFVSKIFDSQDFGYLKITVERPLRLNFAVILE